MAQLFLPRTPKKTQQHFPSSVQRSPSALPVRGVLQTIQRQQRTLGNRQVAKLIQARQLTSDGKVVDEVQRQPGPTADSVTDTDAHGVTRTHKRAGWNKGEARFDKQGVWARAITRHNIVGLTKANPPADDSDVSATHDSSDQSRDVKDVTDEHIKGAVVLIPDPLNASEAVGVDVLFYLHGHGIGFRERKVARFAEVEGKGEKRVKKKRDGKWVMVSFNKVKGMEAGTVRDVDVDHMEEQLGNSIKSSGRPMIAVMPQGAHSGIGQFGGNFNSDAYLNDVFAQTVVQVPRLKNMKLTPGRVIWGGHSGAGNTIPGILANAVDKKGELKSETEMQKAGVPSRLAEVVLFDAIHGSQLYQVTRWLIAQIRSDAKNVAGQPADRQIDYLKNSGMRFRGYYTPGSRSVVTSPDGTPKLHKGKPVVTGYGILYPILKDSIKSELDKQTKVLKLTPDVAAQWRENYQVIPMAKRVGHEQSMGTGKIEEALGAVRPPLTPSTGAAGPAPRSKSISKKIVQPATFMRKQVQHAPVSIQRNNPPASDSDMVKWMEDWNNPDYKEATKLFNGTGRPSGNAETRYKKLCPLYKQKGIGRPLQYLSDSINYDTTFFGYKMRAHTGMQAKLAAAEKTLQGIKDAAGNPKYTAASFKQRPWALEVRTTSANGWSNHAGGKAIDLDPDTNPHLTNKAQRAVITALTGLDIEKSNPGKAMGVESYAGNKLVSDRFQDAYNEAGLTKRIAELKPSEEKITKERDELAKQRSDLAANKKQIIKDRDLALKDKGATAKQRKEIRDKAKVDIAALDRQIDEVKTQLKAKNAQLTSAHQPIKTLEDELKRFQAEQKKFDAATKALEAAESDVAGPNEQVTALSTETEALNSTQKLADDQVKRAKELVQQARQAKAANLGDLRKELKTRLGEQDKAKKAYKAKKAELTKAQAILKKKRKALAARKDKRNAFTLRKYAREGFLNLPEEIVAAMKAAGFQWGGDWGIDTNAVDHKDFMHFDMP